MMQNRVVRWSAIGILVILWGLWLWGATIWFLSADYIDFAAYYNASQRLLNSGEIYTGQTGVVYLYPPLIVQVISGYTRFFSSQTSAIIWHGLSIMFMLISLAILSYAYRGKWIAWGIWLLGLLFTPFLQSYWVGQVSMVLLLCFTGAWLCWRNNKREWVGALLTLATWVKVYPVFLLIYFMIKRDWRTVRGGFVAGFALLGVQLLAGWRYLWQYLTDVLPQLAATGQNYGELWKNNSIFGFSYRLLVDTRQINPLLDAPDFAPLLRYALLLMIVVGAFALVARKGKIQTHSQFDHEYALVLVAAMLFGSTLWTSGMPPLILCYAIWFAHIKRLLMQLLGAISFLLITWMLPTILARPYQAEMSWLTMSVGFFGILLLWILLFYRVARPNDNAL